MLIEVANFGLFKIGNYNLPTAQDARVVKITKIKRITVQTIGSCPEGIPLEQTADSTRISN